MTTKTLHFTIEGEWLTWFLRHLWIEGNEIKAIHTWKASFPQISSPEHIATYFLDVVSGRKKFVGENEFELVKDGSKYWSKVQGGKADKNFPLIDSWEDVIMLKRGRLFLAELNLREHRLRRDYGDTLATNDYNSIKWSNAVEENHIENGMRRTASELWTQVRQISAISGLDATLPELPESADLLTVKKKPRKVNYTEDTNNGKKVYAHIQSILLPIRDHFKKKYKADVFHYRDEEIRELCNLPERSVQPDVDEHPSYDMETARRATTALMTYNPAQSIIPGMKMDVESYIKNMTKDADRDTILAEMVDVTTWQSGYIDREGLFYGCSDIGHKDFSRRLCAQLGFLTEKSDSPSWLKAKRGDKTPDPEIVLDQKGWVRISVNRFYWDANIKLTKSQLITIKDYMAAKKLTQAVFNGITPVTFEEGTKDSK